MSSSVHVDNKGKYILILGEGATQEWSHTLTAEAKYPINFTQSGKSFVLSLHYNRSNNFLFAIATKIQIKANQINSKQKTMHCVQVMLQTITINNMKKTELKGVVRSIFFYFNTIDTSNFIDIHKYLMERTWYKIMLG